MEENKQKDCPNYSSRSVDEALQLAILDCFEQQGKRIQQIFVRPRTWQTLSNSLGSRAQYWWPANQGLSIMLPTVFGWVGVSMSQDVAEGTAQLRGDGLTTTITLSA